MEHGRKRRPTAEETAVRSPSDCDLRVPCYCEENAWRLVRRHLGRDGGGAAAGGGGGRRRRDEWIYRVVFVSNEGRRCPFFRQRALPDRPGEYVCWDYHVLVMRSRVDEGEGASTAEVPSTAEVLDVDTWLPYPCPLGAYLDGSFPHARGGGVDPKYLPCFRVVPARSYLKYFFSDRMHMFKDGRWLSPPPEYEPIMNGLPYAENGSAQTSNLDSYIDMTTGRKTGDDSKGVIESEERLGRVYSLDEFRARFAG